MEFRTLDSTGINEICETFNGAFSDYSVPMNLSVSQLGSALAGDRFIGGFSAGAYEQGKLVGFILHGIDVLNGQRTAYNCGTGVLPGYRGQNITRRLYDFILPLLKEQEIRHSLLEVITTNTRALKIYESIGFKTTRSLICYKGNPLQNRTPPFLILPIEYADWDLLKTFRDWEPSWQHSDAAVENIWNELQAYGIYEDGRLAAYMVMNTERSRLVQFAVHPYYRRKGYGKALIGYAAAICGNNLSVINVDESSQSTNSFLQALGFTVLLNQHEMLLEF